MTTRRVRGLADGSLLLALLGEAIIALVDILLGHTRILTTAYLIPVLVLGLVASGPRTAVVGAAALLVALASGLWDAYLLTPAHLFRTAVVGGGSALSVLGAVFRCRAVRSRDGMQMLVRIGEIADGTSALDTALERLAAVLVPKAADLCELTVLDGAGSDGAGGARVIVLAAGAAAPERVTLAVRPTMADAVARGGTMLLDLTASDTGPAGDDVADRLRAAGMRWVVHVPVRAADRTLALLTLATGPSGRRLSRDDVSFAVTVGSRAALAILNARLLAELSESRARLEAIMSTLADAVTVREPSGRLVYANQAAREQMGFGADEDIGARDPAELLSGYIVTDEAGLPIGLEQLPSVRLLAGEEPAPLVMRVVDGDTGVERWRVLKSAPLRDATGRLEAAVTVIEDITATKRAEMRSSFLSRAGEILASSLDPEETLRNVAQLAVPEIADWVAVELVDTDGRRQAVVAAHRDPAKVARAQRLRELQPRELDPDDALAVVLRTGESVLIPEIPAELLERTARDAEHLALLQELGLRSAIIVALRSTDRVVGAMTLVNAESGRVFTAEDVAFAEQVAARAAVAVENARLYSERSRIASTLQQSLVPEALPDIRGWDLAALYRPAAAGGTAEVGGDFYDVFPAQNGWIVLIGDVTGKGVEAAAMTALVRHGARFTAGFRPWPADILQRLDGYLRLQPELSLCTAVCLRIDNDRIAIASAGHPLPMLVTDDGVRAVGEPGPVLGAFADSEWPVTAVQLRQAETLLMYTDGVTDTVGEDGRFGEERLMASMAECGPRAPAELLGCLDSALSRFQTGAQADDTAALALRLSGRLEGVPASVAASRAGR